MATKMIIVLALVAIMASQCLVNGCTTKPARTARNGRCSSDIDCPVTHRCLLGRCRRLGYSRNHICNPNIEHHCAKGQTCVVVSQMRGKQSAMCLRTRKCQSNADCGKRESCHLGDCVVGSTCGRGERRFVCRTGLRCAKSGLRCLKRKNKRPQPKPEESSEEDEDGNSESESEEDVDGESDDESDDNKDEDEEGDENDKDEDGDDDGNNGAAASSSEESEESPESVETSENSSDASSSDESAAPESSEEEELKQRVQTLIDENEVE